MATANQTSVRPEIDSVLARLRSRIRTYVFLEGSAWVIAALGAVFWVTLALNWAYFKVSNLELPVWFRVAIDVAAIAMLAGVLMLWLVGRLLKNMRTKALALVLERRFPELDDRLITAVEAAESTPENDTAFTRTLRDRTIADVTEATRRLEVGDVFAKRPLQNAALIAVVFVASIVGFGMLNRQAMGYWYKAFLGLEEEYWDRETLLVPKVISPADERSKPFREVGGEYVYKHPRGEDFTLAVTVPDEKNADGVSWVIPEEVEWDYDLEKGRGGAAVIMSKTGERIFRQTVPNLIDGMTFTIRGNDYVNRKPFRVVIVDPPDITETVLHCDYPAYTRLNPEVTLPGETPSNVKTVDGREVSEPMETSILLKSSTNKPLVGVRVEGQNFRLTVKAAHENAAGESVPGRAKFELLAQDGVPYLQLPLAQGFAEKVVEHGESAVNLPIRLATDAPLQLMPPGLPVQSGFANHAVLGPLMHPAELSAWLNRPLKEIPLSANTVLRIFLEDTDDVLSSEPFQLTIKGVEDTPPELVDVEYFGIGEYITPRAMIPIRGTIKDDYGIAQARFDYQLTTEAGVPLTGPGWMAAEFDKPPQFQPREFPLTSDQGTEEETDDEDFVRFDVTKILFQDAAGPRGIAVGDVLQLTIYVEDGDNINGPHIIREKPKPEFVFKVVSRDELLAILYQKELGLLSRFQQIIEEVEGVQKDLQTAQQESADLNKLRMANPNVTDEELFKSLTATAQRSIQQAGKNQNEIRAVAAAFKEVLDELGNNQIATPIMVENLNRIIIKPLDRIGDVGFPNVQDRLETFRVVHTSNQDADPAIAASLTEVNALLDQMRIVFKEMDDFLGFQAMQNNLKEIIQGTEEAKKKAEDEAQDVLDKLKLLD